MTENKRVRIGGILLAAGGSSRMATPKQFIEVEGESLLRRAAVAIASVCEPVIAVLGSEKEKAKKEIAGVPVEPRFNQEWKSGMGSSIRIGLAELILIEPRIDAVLITLCDQPFVTAESLGRLTEQFQRSTKQIVAAEYGDIVGVPAIFSTELFGELLSIDGDKGARGLIRNPGASIETVQIEEAASDIDTIDDLNRLRKYEHGS